MNNLTLSKTEIIQDKQKLQLLGIVLGLRIIFFLLEVGVGIWSHSLSLLAGAGHLLSDLFTLGLTLVTAWLVQHQSLDQAAWKYKRIEAWVGLFNGASLGAVALLIAWEAVKHLQTPEPISGLPVLLVAGLSIVINGLSVQLLHPYSHNDLNFRGVILHGIADAASSISVITAALGVYFFNWLWADASASLLVALFIGVNAILLLKDSWQVLKNVLICQRQEGILG